MLKTYTYFVYIKTVCLKPSLSPEEYIYIRICLYRRLVEVFVYKFSIQVAFNVNIIPLTYI